MSKNWEISGQEKSGTDVIIEAVTLGLVPAPTTYEVTNTESGDVRHVTSYSRDSVGEKIADGKFDRE